MDTGYNIEVFAKARWRWWTGRLGLVVASKGDKWSEGSKRLARKIQSLTEDIEMVKEPEVPIDYGICLYHEQRFSRSTSAQ